MFPDRPQMSSSLNQLLSDVATLRCANTVELMVIEIERELSTALSRTLDYPIDVSEQIVL